MASKKLKKALAAGLLGFGASKAMDMFGAKNTAFKENNIDKGRGSELGEKYRKTKEVTKKAVQLPKKKPLKNVTNYYQNIGKNLGESDSFGLGIYDMNKGGSVQKMVKARGGKMVNLKPTKLY